MRSCTAIETITPILDTWIRQQIQKNPTLIDSISVHFEDGTRLYADLNPSNSSYDLADLPFSFELKEYKRGGFITKVNCSREAERPRVVEFLQSLIPSADFTIPTSKAHQRNPAVQDLTTILDLKNKHEGVPIPTNLFWVRSLGIRLKLVVDVTVPSSASVDGLEDSIMMFVDSLKNPSYKVHRVHRLSRLDMVDYLKEEPTLTVEVEGGLVSDIRGRGGPFPSV
jgi:hypothetical protein